ncbi:hypothetical protein FOZ61_008284 [Perkinsus olseni]|uniref:FHA domain-containing protein n=1 Tax=Perkinsus olseni TaxID=32597 RepID=A0A7J6MB27_PEROL|nr:hypothetical protein FOZ61_008284 [Perkinsus olseni]KAF4668735.1 hypothetical protein FOL46_001827 [Perkinsus olseni]
MTGIVLRMLPPDAFTGIPSTPPEDVRTDADRKLYYILVDAKFVGTAELDRDQSVDDLRLPLLRCPETASLVHHLSSLELADYEGRNTLRLGSRSQVSRAYLTLAVSDRNDSRSAYLVEKSVPSEGSLSLSIGRAPSNDIVLMDRCVSRTHAVLRWQRDEATQSMLAPTIEPLSTSSATWVQIPSLAELPLIAGMSLKLGTESTECRVIRADSESLVLHMPADTVLETPDSSCLPAEMDYGDLVTKIRFVALYHSIDLNYVSLVDSFEMLF